MKVALTPLEFARRARRLFGAREAVVDGDLRFTYEQFFDRCDRWSAALQRLGVKAGDRVAYIAPNTHAQLESFYAVPQIGAILVPINYRLTADDFAYIIKHSGATVVCVAPTTSTAVESIRDQLPAVAHFVALEGARDGWLDYERNSPRPFRRRNTAVRATRDRRRRPPHDQLHERHDGAAEGRDDHASKCLHQHGRHARCIADDPRDGTSGRCRCSTPTAGRSRGS